MGRETVSIFKGMEYEYVDSMSTFICNRDSTVLLVSVQFLVYELIVMKNCIAWVQCPVCLLT